MDKKVKHSTLLLGLTGHCGLRRERWGRRGEGAENTQWKGLRLVFEASVEPMYDGVKMAGPDIGIHIRDLTGGTRYLASKKLKLVSPPAAGER